MGFAKNVIKQLFLFLLLKKSPSTDVKKTGVAVQDPTKSSKGESKSDESSEKTDSDMKVETSDVLE